LRTKKAEMGFIAFPCYHSSARDHMTSVMKMREGKKGKGGKKGKEGTRL